MESENDFRYSITAFSGSITVEWVFGNKNHINQTMQFETLINFFPPLSEVFMNWQREEPQEFFRTIIHTFQTQAAYNSICSANFPESGLNKEAIDKVNDLAKSISSFSPLLIPVILWLHDIGRYVNRQIHNEKSAEMITEMALLENRGLSAQEIILIKKVVQYHLLIGTLYTGESSYLSFEPLLMDKEFKTILNDESSIKLFINSLTLFTMIDVWGYHINDISQTMIDNYIDIRDEMSEIFVGVNDIDQLMEGLREKSRKHIDWRLMGFMLAFSKIGTKPHLTIDFYSKKINDSFKRYTEREALSIDWHEFKNQYLNKIDQVQFKYGLGVLIPLSYGGTGRKMHLTVDTEINPNLLHLLVNINNRIKNEENLNTECIADELWNVVFVGFPPWNRDTNFHEILNTPGQIEEIVKSGKVSVNKQEGVNILTIDYSNFWCDIT